MNAFGVVPRWRSSNPWSAEQPREARAREVVDVRRDHRPPARAHHARDAAAGVGQHQHDAAARREQRRGPGRAPRRDRAGARSRRRARPPGARRRAGRPSSGRRSARRAAAARARSPDAKLLGSTPVTGSQPRRARLVEQEADPAPEVQQRAPSGRAARAARAGRARSRAAPPPPRRSRRTRPRRRPRSSSASLGISRELHVAAVRRSGRCPTSAVPNRSVVGIRPSGPCSPATARCSGQPVSTADDAARAHAARG